MVCHSCVRNRFQLVHPALRAKLYQPGCLANIEWLPKGTAFLFVSCVYKTTSRGGGGFWKIGGLRGGPKNYHEDVTECR